MSPLVAHLASAAYLLASIAVGLLALFWQAPDGRTMPIAADTPNLLRACGADLPDRRPYPDHQCHRPGLWCTRIGWAWYWRVPTGARYLCLECMSVWEVRDYGWCEPERGWCRLTPREVI